MAEVDLIKYTGLEGNGIVSSAPMKWKNLTKRQGKEILSKLINKSQTRPRNFTFTFHFHALGKEMATHSSVLAWRTPEIGAPGGLLSVGLHRVGQD